jgi:SMC interacting uncharacterized protein involved in chromosome segregation
MNEFPNSICTKHGEDIATLKEKTDNLENRVDDLSVIKSAVIETTTYIKILTESQKEQSVTLSQITQTMIKQNETLDRLNEKIDKTDDKVEDLSQKFEEVKSKQPSDLESKLEAKLEEIDNKSKIDLLILFKQYAIPALLGGGFVYVVTQIVG